MINVNGAFDGLDSMRFKSTNAEGNITVYGLGENGEDLIVNKIGNFSGKYLVPSGTVLLRISSDGRWEMKRLERRPGPESTRDHIRSHPVHAKPGRARYRAASGYGASALPLQHPSLIRERWKHHGNQDRDGTPRRH